jgi:hypothetical protein
MSHMPRAGRWYVRRPVQLVDMLLHLTVTKVVLPEPDSHGLVELLNTFDYHRTIPSFDVE